MNNDKAEKNTEKSFDIKLMKRLLKYAKPFLGTFILCFILLMLITVTDLARPYLMHIAIDDYIKSYDIPMVAFDEKPDKHHVKFNNKYLVRLTKLNKSFDYKDMKIYQILKNNDDYFLVDWRSDYDIIKSNNTPSDLLENLQLLGTKYSINIDNNKYEALLLDNETYSNFRSRDKIGVRNISLLFLLTICMGFILNYIQMYLLNYSGLKIIYNMRQEVFTHMQKLSMSFFDKNPVGKLVTRITNDMENIAEMYTAVIVNLFKDIFILVGIIIIMLKMNARVALVCFTVVPLIIIATSIFRVKIRNTYRLIRVRIAKINTSLSENISGMKLIQIFSNESTKYNEFKKVNYEHRNANIQEMVIYAVFRPAMDFFYSLALSLLLWYGGAKVLTGELSFGVLFAFINYIQQFFQPINDLAEKFNILQSAMASSEKVFNLLDEKEDIMNIDSPKNLGSSIKGELEFKNVWFAYNDDNWVLKDVSFKINFGETIAFVGATGAGKTSIINLICRFYDIQKGEILIDGINIKNLNKYELRSHICTVLQDVFLFTGDIKSNIRLNQDNISDQTIKEVSKFVNANSFIENLPDKYNEEVKERGVTLSSGQRQLLAFARALAFNPSILILDEATSSIDTETELLIQDAIKKIIKNRTTIVIAHRLSTIQHSNKIIVMHKGQVKEIGKHQELLNKKGMYYDLYQLQYKDDYKLTANL